MAVYLDVRTALTRIEQAMVDAISLAFGWRRPAVADLAALAALEAAPAWDGQLCFVQDQGVVYRFKRYSLNADNRPAVVRPDGLTESQPGRWERQTSQVTKGPNHYKPVHRVEKGYAKQVILWEGQGDNEEALNRIFGSTPAFLVRWESTEVGTRKTAGPLGALYSYDLSFTIQCYSKNYRPQNQALYGSDVESEQGDDKDPGLNRMIGDLHYLFGNACQLGLAPGVGSTLIAGTVQIVYENLDSREFVANVPILVQASLNIPDEDLVPIDQVWVQFQDASTGIGQDFDGDNYLLSGYRLNVGAGTGLAQAPTPGVAYVNGQLDSSQPGAHTFAANKQTFRWLLPSGALFYYETDIGHPLTEGPTGALLIGATQTDATDITFDALLCSYLNNQGEPFRAV